MASSSSSSSSRSSKYQSLDQRTHVLHRPDTYIGTIKNVNTDYYGASLISPNEDEKKESHLFFIKKEKGEINRGLHRIFIEILSNAIDNVWRSLASDTKTTKIKIDITEDGWITIHNDGQTIPIEIHPETGIYNPELIFGRLLTSSNYNDEEERMTSGRNGLGGKVTNVFSKEFSVKIFDPETGHQYIQTWKNNMSEKTSPKITSPKTKHGSTEISFLPDYERFGLEGLSKDMKQLFLKNIIDTAMITGVNVFYNNEKIPMKTLKDYALLYRPVDEREDKKKEMIMIETDDSQMVFTTQPRSEFSHISFVNGIETYHGGVHVDSWSEAILRPILEKINSKVKKGNAMLTMKDIRPFFRIFLNCKLPNPTFTSQEKSQLGSPSVKIPEIDTKFINQIMKWDVMQEIVDLLSAKEMKEMKTTEKKRGFVKIPGLDPANLAGSKQFDECSLILCEGDSAKTFAVKGIQTGVGGKKGRDYFGIFPLRGKLLNVRNSNVSSIADSKEICGVIKALNLRYDVDYREEKNYSSLMYGRVIILTDSDVDGYHICGLLLNFFHKLYPTLLERNPSFLTCMRTPIVRIYYPKSEMAFYTLYEYQSYLSTHPNKKGEIKYFKGLGTNNNEEITKSFGKKMIEFVKDEKTDEKMDQVFHSTYSHFRKEWLRDYKPTEEDEKNLVGQGLIQKLSITDFMDFEMIKFSIDDCKRNIANVMDGLKESQRKILHATFLKHLKFSGKTMKVAQLAGFVAEKTNYHHGEQCLFDTITKMAHDFVGSNNIPLLARDGQFGSKLAGGKDAANARYIFTKLDALTRLLFRPEDDVLLNYIIDEGEPVEPEYYLPILPMVLINGTEGIGTGWSSEISCYNPIDLIQCVKAWLNNNMYDDSKEDHKDDKDENVVMSVYPEIHPWYRGFTGTIEKVNDNKYITRGIIEKTVQKGVTKAIVKECPIGLWTEKFKDHLDKLLEEKKIKSVKNNSTDIKIHLEIEELKENGLECTLESLGLTSTLSMTNMVLFNHQHQIHKYRNVDEIIDEFCQVRYRYYIKRKERLQSDLSYEITILENKIRFLQSVMDGSLIIQDVDETVLARELEEKGYYKNEKTGEMDEDESKLSAYRYLIQMNIRSFTKQKINELRQQIQKLREKWSVLESISYKQMWMNDLEEFEAEYHKIY
jgi:DNA topoisomerase-2